MSRLADFDPRPFALPPELAERLLTPALLVDLDRVRANVARVIELAGGDPDRWRPHVKTTKIPEVWKVVAEAGVRHFKCATTRELAVLLDTLAEAEVDAPDVLVAYPHVKTALARIGEIARAHPEARVSVLAECPAAVAEIPPAVSIFVDVNPGMNRTGIPARDAAAIESTVRAAGERFRGLHFYEGHLHQASLDERRRAAFAAYDHLLVIADALGTTGHPVGELITSGTPGFTQALAYTPFRDTGGPRHRISPGTVVFHDLRSEQENPQLGLHPAAVLLVRVISHPTEEIATCDAGSKSIAAEAGDPCAYVLGRPELVPLAPSEEHLPLHVTNGAPPRRGDLLHLFPLHVCPTTNLQEEVVLLEGGEVRGVASVAARAHDILPTR